MNLINKQAREDKIVHVLPLRQLQNDIVDDIQQVILFLLFLVFLIDSEDLIYFFFFFKTEKLVFGLLAIGIQI